MPSLPDNCGDMVLVLDQDTILTDALGNYTITRTFTVTTMRATAPPPPRPSRFRTPRTLSSRLCLLM